MQPGLYLVAVPIGHFEDITLRALRTLKEVDAIFCEDTRVTGPFLKKHEISTKLMTYHEHNAEEMRPKIIENIKKGAKVALVSDAGTPLISDPGYKLVREIVDKKLHVTSLPGPCAAVMALSMSALPSDQFVFHGFLPAKTKARCDVLKSLENLEMTLIFYESPHRLIESLSDVKEVLGNRSAVIAREMTKEYEEARRGLLSELIEHYTSKPAKGEIVVLVEGYEASEMNEVQVDSLLTEALQSMSVKEAAASLVSRTGWSKKRLYDRALKLKD